MLIEGVGTLKIGSNGIGAYKVTPIYHLVDTKPDEYELRFYSHRVTQGILLRPASPQYRFNRLIIDSYNNHADATKGIRSLCRITNEDYQIFLDNLLKLT